MSSLTVVVILSCVLLISGVVGQNNDVCLSLPRTPVDANRRELQGVPGKRGPVGGIGPKGDQGSKGEPGDVESCGCKPGDVISLQEQIRILSSSVQKFCFNGMIYGSQCIRLISGRRTSVNYKQAQDFCSGRNASLVDITSGAMYDEVYNFVYSQLKTVYGPSFNGANIWLASTFQVTNNPKNLVTLSNGRKVRLARWLPGNPRKGSGSVNLLMWVNSDVGSSDKDIWNFSPTGTRSGYPLCSYNTVLDILFHWHLML